MLPPFQKILYCRNQNTADPGIILLASGPSIYAFRAAGGRILSDWSVGDVPEHQYDQKPPENPSKEAENQSGGPPAKKRKVTKNGNVTDASSEDAEIVTENGKNTKRPPKKKSNGLPSVIHMQSSRDGRKVIVATGEDKAIRVLELSEDGNLSTLSKRFLPKKPSGIALTADQQTILVADKFGDVYGLPLQPPKPTEADAAAVSKSELITQRAGNDVPFKPSATELTVHTKKNLQALRNQLASKGLGEKTKRATEYQPLTGHVSMLTDIVGVATPDKEGGRSYILTADRDEHIRVSRGPPQAHVIEGFCLGHTEFVSKLCVLPWNRSILISGGGDDYLLVWNWQSGEILQTVHLRSRIDGVRMSWGRPENEPIVVSGLWTCPMGTNKGTLIVACEGLPALLAFEVDPSGNVHVQHPRTLKLPSNVLDVAIIDASPEQDFPLIAWTVDNTHEPCSTQDLRKTWDETLIGVHPHDQEGEGWEPLHSKSCDPLAGVKGWLVENWEKPALYDDDPARRRGFYYGMEHLRKTRTEEIEQREASAAQTSL